MGCECNKVCAECKRKVRPEAEMRDMVNRLSRIEGQIRGLRGMVEKSAYCGAYDIFAFVSITGMSFYRYSAFKDIHFNQFTSHSFNRYT